MGKVVKKDNRITNLRTIAIFLVVFGHSIILYEYSWGFYVTEWNVPILNYIKMWIDSIQMQLFLSISGYLFYGSYKKTNFILLIRKKVVRILLPFITVAVIWLIPVRKLIDFGPYQGRSIITIIWKDIILGSNNGHLWYLPCLFLCFVVSYVLLKGLDLLFKQNELLKSFIILMVSYLLSYFFYLFVGFPGVEVVRAFAIWWIWFCVGILIRKHSNVLDSMKPYKWIIFSGAFVISIIRLFMSIPFTKMWSFILLIAFYLIIPQRTRPMLEFISRNSFGIYLFHSPLVYITYSQMANAYPVFVVFINFIIWGILALLMTIGIRKTKLKFLIGE